MKGITHKQARRYMLADLDGLLTDDGRRALQTHLDSCPTCLSDSQSFSKLTSRLQTELHARWDTHDGPSHNVMTNIRLQTRRITMQNRINLAFKILGSIAALLVASVAINAVVSQLAEYSTTSNQTQTNIPASSATDNRLLAFTSDKDGNAEVYTVRADGSDMINITNNPARDANPFWSPDGKQIAFESDHDGYSQIFLMNADGSNRIQLTDDKTGHNLPLNIDGASNPWSPDGKKLLFLQQNSNADTWTLQFMNIDGKDIISLASGRISFNDISWSPDGRHIGFIINDSQNTDPNTFVPRLHVVSADGSNLTEVTKILPADEYLGIYNPVSYYWAHDGQSIIFIASNLPASGAYSASSDSSNPYYWKVYEIRLADKELRMSASTRSPIGGWWQESYFITPFVGTQGWTWISPDNITTVNPFKNCNDQSGGGSRYQQSPNGNVVIGVMCPNFDWWLYWINPKGAMLPLMDSPISTSQGDLENLAWSDDDTLIAFNMTINSNTDLYIVNVTETLKDPAIQPVKISLGKSGFNFPLAWQPTH